MLTFSVLHVALKNYVQTFRQWRCYSRPARLVTKQFYTTQISNLKTQKLLIVSRGIELWRKKTSFSAFLYFFSFFFVQSQFSDFFSSNFTYFWSRFRLHSFEELRTKTENDFHSFRFSWQLLFPKFKPRTCATTHFLSVQLPKKVFSFVLSSCSFNTSFFNVMNNGMKKYTVRSSLGPLKLTRIFHFFSFSVVSSFSQPSQAWIRWLSCLFFGWERREIFYYVRACIGWRVAKLLFLKIINVNKNIKNNSRYIWGAFMYVSQ